MLAHRVKVIAYLEKVPLCYTLQGGREDACMQPRDCEFLKVEIVTEMRALPVISDLGQSSVFVFMIWGCY